MSNYYLKDTERGAVLVTSLLLLVILSVVVFNASNRTSMDLKMTANLNDRTTAFQSAESVMRDASEWISTRAMPVYPTNNGRYGVYSLGEIGLSPGQSDFDWYGLGRMYGSQTRVAALDGVYAQPRYTIELSGFIADSLNPDDLARGIGRYYYSVSAIGWGKSAGVHEKDRAASTALSVIQSTLAKRYN